MSGGRWERIREIRGLANERFGVELADRRWQAVTEDAHLARGYAWGHQDARAEALGDRLAAVDSGVVDSGDAYEFSLEFAIHSARYAAELRPWKTNVPNAYAHWRSGKTDESQW